LRGGGGHGPSEDRRRQVDLPVPGVPFGEALGARYADGAHADVDRTRSERPEETLDRLLHGLVFGQHGDDGVHAARGIRWGVRQRRAILTQRLGVRARAIVHSDLMAGAQQVARHGRTHISGADECEFHGNVILTYG
jgi:hypothetical protein